MKSSIYDYLLPYEGKTIKLNYSYHSGLFFIGVGMSNKTYSAAGTSDDTAIIQKVLPDAIVIKVGVRPGGVFSSNHHTAYTQIIPFGNMHIAIADEKTAS
jgi:hypothetical protein